MNLQPKPMCDQMHMYMTQWLFKGQELVKPGRIAKGWSFNAC